MRRAYQGTEFLEENGILFGINLGYDYCAEHEWGIKSLQKDFGLKLEEKLGFEARKNTIVPAALTYIKGRTSALIYEPNGEPERRLKRRDLDYSLDIAPGKELAAAWDEPSFGINARLKHDKEIKGLYEAFQGKNGIIMLSARSNPFANSGLMLLDYTKIPEKIKEEFRASDKKYRDEQALCRAATPMG